MPTSIVTLNVEFKPLFLMRVLLLIFKLQWWLHYENKNTYYVKKYNKVVRESGEDTANPN